jgi:hypothetical protein
MDDLSHLQILPPSDTAKTARTSYRNAGDFVGNSLVDRALLRVSKRRVSHMPNFEYAAFNKQGMNMIVIFVDDSFDAASESEQSEVREELQHKAGEAGLAGTVTLVWRNSSGAMGFLAPRQWHDFFLAAGYSLLFSNIDGELMWA